MTNVKTFESPAAEYAEVYALLARYEAIGDRQAVNILRFRLQALARDIAPQILHATLHRTAQAIPKRLYAGRVPLIWQQGRHRWRR